MRTPSENDKWLSENEWDAVFNQIRSDLKMGDFQAMYEMLDQLPPRILRGYVEETDDE